MAVEGAEVVDAEVLEEGRRFEHLAHRGLGPLDAPFQVAADHGQVAEDLLQACLLAPVDGIGSQPGQALAEP